MHIYNKQIERAMGRGKSCKWHMFHMNNFNILFFLQNIVLTFGPKFKEKIKSNLY